MRRQGWIAIVLVAWVVPLRAQDQKKEEAPAPQKPVTKRIRGRVVNKAGKPVAGIALSSDWVRLEDGPERNRREVVKTDGQGHFHIELTLPPDDSGQSSGLYAFDPERHRGGLAVVGPKTPDEPITIQAGPLVHVHGKYTCKELGKPVGWTTSVFTLMPERWMIYQHFTKKAECSVLLPPGRYQLQGIGDSGVVESHRRDLTLTPDQLDVDLGEIDLPASAVAKLKGKPAPSLHPTDARE